MKKRTEAFLLLLHDAEMDTRIIKNIGPITSEMLPSDKRQLSISSLRKDHHGSIMLEIMITSSQRSKYLVLFPRIGHNLISSTHCRPTTCVKAHLLGLFPYLAAL